VHKARYDNERRRDGCNCKRLGIWGYPIEENRVEGRQKQCDRKGLRRCNDYQNPHKKKDPAKKPQGLRASHCQRHNVNRER